MLKFNNSESHILYQALCNEIRLDQRYKEVFETKGHFIDYKIMKQVAIKSKLGLLLTPAMFTLAWIMPAILFVRWTWMLCMSLRSTVAKKDTQSVWVVPTTPNNEALIRIALAREKRTNIHTLTLNNLSTYLPSRLGMGAVLAAGWQALCVVLHIVLFGKNRTALLLHARDAMNVLLLAKFARANPSDLFATDCHYQRWSFVLSHTAKNLTLVQHGTLDLAIGFPYLGGTVQQIITRDKKSAKGWHQYYKCIQKDTVYAPIFELDANPYANAAIFLASSFPTVGLEITFIHALRQAASMPLIVKLHPVHRYDSRGLQLIALADYVCRPDENPSCAVFVSHSSSMEMIYRQHGIPTVSLLHESTTSAAVAATINALCQDIRDNFKTSA